MGILKKIVDELESIHAAQKMLDTLRINGKVLEVLNNGNILYTKNGKYYVLEVKM